MKRQTSTITRVFPNDLERLKKLQEKLRALHPEERMNSADTLNHIINAYEKVFYGSAD